MHRSWYALKDVFKGIPAISPLSLLQAIRRPRALPTFHSDVLRAYRANAGLRASSILPFQLLQTKGPATSRTGENGVFPLHESQYLVVELVALLQPKAAFEIGTMRGLLTSLIAMNMPSDGCVFTLDLPSGAVPEHASDLQYIERVELHLGDFFRNTPWMGKKIRQLRGNSLQFDFSPFYDKMDFVLVDASHTDAAVFSDSMNAFRMIKVGGVILWHDYESMRSEYGVTRCVDRMRDRHHCPIYRLSSEWGDTRYAVLKVDDEIKQRMSEVANAPSVF